MKGKSKEDISNIRQRTLQRRVDKLRGKALKLDIEIRDLMDTRIADDPYAGEKCAKLRDTMYKVNNLIDGLLKVGG